MDPLTAIGLVSNILSFIDFSARLLKGAKEVHDSHHGALEENRNRETVMREMQRMTTRMLVPNLPEKADDNSSLCILASECRQLSAQLVSLLEKIKPDDSGSKAQSVLSAIRNKVYDSERENLEARLGDCRAQLHLELSNLTSAETLKRLESLVQASKTDEAKMDRIESHIAQLRENIGSKYSASEMAPMLNMILAEEEKVFTTIAQDRILNSLSFEGMSRRSNMVVETHANTYEWILGHDSTAEESAKEEGSSVAQKESDVARISEDIEKVRARDKLREWLEGKTSGDVFHLSGKLGSGKSTLMKHIRASPRTEEKLNKWADGRKLTIANFYFWNIGSDYDKSLQGLYTSLLHQIFQQCPDIIPQVWPANWAQVHSAPWLVPRVIEVTKRDVMQAFERVIKSDDALRNYCFAFFIDGLDEFQSTVEDDHRDLVRLLCQWAASESGNIKICVSSREYPVFMDGFTPTLRIRFHDLTRRDMDIFIRDKLAHASAEQSFESLISLIMDKADGVFLWVALVVKSLREGIENGQSCCDLTREVDILPDQLESLYRHILASLGKSARRKAYQTFAMVTELKRENYRMSLLAYSFFEEYETGKDLFMKEHNLFPIESVTGDRGKKLAHSTSRKLAGWCKGLVEPYGNPIWLQDQNQDWMKTDSPHACVEAWGDWSMELDFAHRSVADFLGSDEVQQDMELNLGCFDPVDAVLQLILSDVLLESSISVYNTLRSGITSAVFLRTIYRHGLAREPFTYFERVRKLLASTKPSELMRLRTSFMLTYPCKEGGFESMDYIQVVGKLTGETAYPGNVESRTSHFSDPLHILTITGHTDYPLWCINNSSGFCEQPETISTLACICLDGGVGRKDLIFQPIALLEALFSRGWVSPDSITHCRVLRYSNMWSCDPGHHSGLDSDLTLWHRFLINMLSGRYHHGTVSPDPADRKRHFERRQYHGKLLELFLRLKEKADFSFEIRVDEETTVSRRDFVINLGKQGLTLKFRTARFEQDPGRRLPWAENKIGLQSEDGTPARRYFSLRQFIELSEFDNRFELLKLLDQKSKRGDDEEPSKSTVAETVARKEGHVVDRIQRADEGGKMRKTDDAMVLKLANRIELNHYLEIVSRRVRCSLKSECVRYAIAVLTGVVLTVLFASVRERLAGTPSV